MTGRHLILGGTGFIGRHVAALLVDAGHQVSIASRTDPAERLPRDLAGAVPWTPFEMHTADWERLVSGADVVYHLAWSSLPATANADPVADLEGNVAATVRLLDAARRCPAPPRVVFASSGGTVYGRLRNIPVPEHHPLAPITGYGAGKAAVEMYMGFYRALHGLDCRVGRVANPFGAGQDVSRGQGAVTAFLGAALAGTPIQIWGDGEVVRDYIHISDAAAGLVQLATAEPSAGPCVYNLGSGAGVSLNEIVAELEAQLGCTLAVERSPGRPFDVPVSVLDIAAAGEGLGWAPRLSFAGGIARTIADLRRATPATLAG